MPSVLAPWAAAAGVVLGSPRYDDDSFAAKVDLLVAAAPSLVSFAFGWPPAEAVARLQSAGVQVWVTLNEPAEVEWAEALGVDGIVAQGWEAGGHRGGPVDTGAEQLPVRELVRAVRARTSLPVIAAGGLMTGGEAAEVLSLGASAVAFGTAFLGCPEAGTAEVHAHALAHREGTVVTRAFTGRSARALRTAWTDGYGAAAPAAYPHVHHVTAPAARARQGHRGGRARPPLGRHGPPPAARAAGRRALPAAAGRAGPGHAGAPRRQTGVRTVAGVR